VHALTFFSSHPRAGGRAVTVSAVAQRLPSGDPEKQRRRAAWTETVETVDVEADEVSTLKTLQHFRGFIRIATLCYQQTRIRQKLAVKQMTESQSFMLHQSAKRQPVNLAFGSR
jgi:hypothetical protein